jgi:uncharacterized protein (DUF39 family)
VFDYGFAERSRPSLGRVTYAELRSGQIRVNGTTVPTGPVSSLPKARLIAETLKEWIAERRWTLTAPVAPLPKRGEQGVKPLEIRQTSAPDAEGLVPEGTDEIEEVV